MPKMSAAISLSLGASFWLRSPYRIQVRITTTTICGTDVHILKGEYPASEGLTIGHEPVGVITKLGSQIRGYQEGQRVIAGAITPETCRNPAVTASTVPMANIETVGRDPPR